MNNDRLAPGLLLILVGKSILLKNRVENVTGNAF